MAATTDTLSLEELADRVKELERLLADALPATPDGSVSATKRPPSRASEVLRRAPRSHFENTALVTFTDREVVSVRKYFNHDEARPLKRTPYIRMTPRVHELLEFLYRFKGANYGIIAKRGIWSNRGKHKGHDAVTTNMLHLAAAGLVERNRYSHKKIVQDRELLAPEGRPVRDKPWVHTSLTTKAIRLLKADGTIATGTNPTVLRDRLLGGRNEANWSHQNNALDAALNVVNLAGGLDNDGNTVSYELGKSERELHHEQAAFLSVAPATRRGLTVSEVLELAGDKLSFGAYKGSLLAPDVTLVKTVTRPDGTTHRAEILFEYDQGNYARTGILENKMGMLRGPFGRVGSPKPPKPDDDGAPDEEAPDQDHGSAHDKSEPHPAYKDMDDYMQLGDPEATPRKQSAQEKAEEQADHYFAAKLKEYDDIKLVFVSYNDTVRRGEKRALGAEYEPTDKELANPKRAAYIARMSERREYIASHCEFVTLAELEQGVRIG
jgi:hypothetical protein